MISDFFIFSVKYFLIYSVGIYVSLSVLEEAIFLWALYIY